MTGSDWMEIWTNVDLLTVLNALGLMVFEGAIYNLVYHIVCCTISFPFIN